MMHPLIERIAIIGAGGCARELAWLLEDISAAAQKGDRQYSTLGYLRSDAKHPGLYDSPVLGDFSWLESNHVDGLVMGIGSPAIRLALAAQLKEQFPHISWPALVHPTVVGQRGTMELSEGVVLCAGSSATVNVHFEAFSFINVSCTIGHETVIGSGCVVNPGANIAGGVRLGRGVLVGTGAQVLQYLNVGEGAQIGAGAVVTKDVMPYTTVVGVPATEMPTKQPGGAPQCSSSILYNGLDSVNTPG